MMDVVSHEFFHIVTPLSIHSKEIQDFDYNDPKMSQHLWMYEGVTEYFANLFKSIKD
jgi:predicted metalloprotease with PDZ domain